MLFVSVFFRVDPVRWSLFQFELYLNYLSLLHENKRVFITGICCLTFLPCSTTYRTCINCNSLALPLENIKGMKCSQRLFLFSYIHLYQEKSIIIINLLFNAMFGFFGEYSFDNRPFFCQVYPFWLMRNVHYVEECFFEERVIR